MKYINKYTSILLSAVSLFALQGTASDLKQEIEEVNKNLSPLSLLQNNEALSLKDLPAEIKIRVFSFLNQKNIPPVSLVNKEFNALFNDNHLWYGYAQRASLVKSHNYREDIQYRELVQSHCVYAFKDLGANIDANDINDKGDIAGSVLFTDSNGRNKKVAFVDSGKAGIKYLPMLNDKDESFVKAINEEGTVAVGDYNSLSRGPCLIQAFKWNLAKNEMKFLGTINGGRESGARAVCEDGTIVVGQADDGLDFNKTRAVIWTEAQGVRSLRTLNGGEHSEALGISSDGKVVVGKSGRSAFIWTEEASEMRSLGKLNKGYYSSARAISANGTVVAGLAHDNFAGLTSSAFKWSRAQGIPSLGTLEGRKYSQANAISADGTVVVGCSDDGFQDENSLVYIWTEAAGMRSVQEILETQEWLPEGWQLTDIKSISASVTFMVGKGTYLGKDHAFKAVIPRGNFF